MKGLKFLFIIALIAISLVGFSQKTFIGSIFYKVEIDAEDLDPQTKAAMFTNFNIITNGSKTRVELSSPMYSITTVTDNQTGIGFTLFDGIGLKMAADLTKEYIEKEKAKSAEKESASKPQINYIDETKTIAGYKCKKAEIIEESSEPIIVFYTEDIVLPKNDNSSTLSMISGFKDLKGFPMEYIIESDGSSMKFMVNEVLTKKPKASLFSIDDDYTKMPIDEMMRMLSGGE